MYGAGAYGGKTTFSCAINQKLTSQHQRRFSCIVVAKYSSWRVVWPVIVDRY